MAGMGAGLSHRLRTLPAMQARVHDPARLDVAAFAADGGCLGGTWPGAGLARLADSQAPPQDDGAAPVTWQCRGERRIAPGHEAQVWLHLSARTDAWLTCQRCLQPIRHPLVVDRWIRFVHGEAQAEALDAESEHDVLALTRALDLGELIEDELLLALPLVPRHEACVPPLPWQAEATEEVPASGPFAGLAGWRGGRSSG